MNNEGNACLQRKKSFQKKKKKMNYSFSHLIRFINSSINSVQSSYSNLIELINLFTSFYEYHFQDNMS